MSGKHDLLRLSKRPNHKRLIVNIIKAVLLISMLAAVPATASVGISAQCDAGDVTLNISMFITDEWPADWVGFVVERSQLGICDSGVIITAEPIPVPTQLFTLLGYTFSDPIPTLGHYYGYKVWAVDTAGALHMPPPMGFPWLFDYTACGEAVATRGRLMVTSYEYKSMSIFECEDRCWGVCAGGELPVSPEQFDAWLPYAQSGETVDVYGEIRHDEMPTGYCLWTVDRVEAVPGEDPCGAVPEQQHSWGDVKAMFR